MQMEQQLTIKFKISSTYQLLERKVRGLSIDPAGSDESPLPALEDAQVPGSAMTKFGQPRLPIWPGKSENPCVSCKVSSGIHAETAFFWLRNVVFGLNLTKETKVRRPREGLDDILCAKTRLFL